MDLDLRLVRYFLAVADAENFGRAAKVLHIATPSLSQQIAAFEKRLGFRLLERDHRGARLTDAGREFAPAARRVLAEADAALAVAQRLRGDQRSILRLGVVTGTAGLISDAVVTRFKEMSDDAQIEFVPVSLSHQLEAITRGTVDCLLARPPIATGDRFHMITLSPDRRVVVMRIGHPLASKKDLSWQDLQPFEQVDTDVYDAEWKKHWSLDPRPDGSRPRYGPIARDVDQAYEFVAHSDVIAPTAESVARLYPRPDCCWRFLTDVDPLEIALVMRRNSDRGSLIRLLIDAVELERGATTPS